MAITDADRARIGELTLKAFDALDEFGPDVVLEDALIIFEVSYPDETEEDVRRTELVARTTTHRPTVASGIAQAYVRACTGDWTDRRDLEDED